MKKNSKPVPVNFKSLQFLKALFLLTIVVGTLALTSCKSHERCAAYPTSKR
ncbi:MAG: hypothetical protein IAF38_20650 [Bacteroidia bacterium]|nr:hypothetical protein [Bacteroidia bacterium]